MAAGQIVSLRPSTFVQGGLIDDVDVTIARSVMTYFNYNGTQPNRTVLNWLMVDDDGGNHDQHFSAADPKDFVPSADGNFVVATGENGAMVKGTNYDTLVQSMIDLGFPEPLLDQGASVFTGMKVHVKRRPAKKREGIIPEPGQPQKGPATELYVSAILIGPGAKGAGVAGAPMPVATARPAVAQAAVMPAPSVPTAVAPPAGVQATPGGVIDYTAIDNVLFAALPNILAAMGGAGTTRQLVQKSLNLIPGTQAEKQLGIKRLYDPEFLSMAAAMGYLVLDATGTNVSAPPAA